MFSQAALWHIPSPQRFLGIHLGGCGHPLLSIPPGIISPSLHHPDAYGEKTGQFIVGGQGANSQLGPVRPTALPSGQSLASSVQAVRDLQVYRTHPFP